MVLRVVRTMGWSDDCQTLIIRSLISLFFERFCVNYREHVGIGALDFRDDNESEALYHLMIWMNCMIRSRLHYNIQGS